MLLETARKLITFAAENLHSSCLLFAPSGAHQELYQSFVCGASLRDPTLSRLYTELGLIHVVVVSGAHLIFLDSLLRLFRRDDSPWPLPFLALYCLITGFEAPVVRSFLQMILRVLQKRWQLHWTFPVETLAAGLATLLLLGPSLSLQLSWVASLGLASRGSAWATQLRVYLFLTPLLATLQVAHPATVPVNLALAPVISAVAFPASLLCFVFSPLARVVDPFWTLTHEVLSWLSQEIFLGAQAPALHGGPWIWFYIASLQGFLMLHFCWQKRRSRAGR